MKKDFNLEKAERALQVVSILCILYTVSSLFSFAALFLGWLG